jgi:hypothetical protein
MKNTKEQKVPKWFEGKYELYNTGAIVSNVYSGQDYELNALELSIYDVIIGAQANIDFFYDGDVFDPNTANLQREITQKLIWYY